MFGLPSFPRPGARWPNFSNRIKLGLDLQGGTHLVLQVQVQEAIATQRDQTIDALNDQLHKQNIPYDEIREVSDTQILVHNVAPASTGALQAWCKISFPNGIFLRRRASNPVS